MRLKYYLRGLGIGIIVTTIILSISFSLKKDTISDEEIIARAEQLGMIMPETEETNGGDSSGLQENREENPQDEQNQDGHQSETQQELKDTQLAGQDAEEQEAEPAGQDAGEQEAEPAGQDADGDNAESQQAEGEVYQLTIYPGDVCRTVCENLAAGGVIDDAEALRKYLLEIGIASNLSTGKYEVPYGLTMEEVAQILKNGPMERMVE